MELTRTIMGVRLCIEGLPYWVTADDLKEVCTQHGSVVSVRLVTDSYGLSLGYGFVEMATAEEASQAVEALNEREHFGCLIRVTSAP